MTFIAINATLHAAGDNRRHRKGSVTHVTLVLLIAVTRA
jgi:hypothetical protein